MSKDIRKAIKQIVSEIRFKSGDKGIQFTDEFIQAYSKVLEMVDAWSAINGLMGVEDQLEDIIDYGSFGVDAIIDNGSILKGALFAYITLGAWGVMGIEEINEFIEMLESYLEIGEDEVKEKLLNLGWIR
jgi:hypothetical protein